MKLPLKSLLLTFALTAGVCSNAYAASDNSAQIVNLPAQASTPLQSPSIHVYNLGYSHQLTTSSPAGRKEFAKLLEQSDVLFQFVETLKDIVSSPEVKEINAEIKTLTGHDAILECDHTDGFQMSDADPCCAWTAFIDGAWTSYGGSIVSKNHSDAANIEALKFLLDRLQHKNLAASDADLFSE
jgi:hypothetical protein